MSGEKVVQGLWLAQRTEGAKLFWLQVVSELRNRGQDIFIACFDGLKVFSQDSSSVVHRAQARHCLNYVSWKRRKEVAANLRRIYTAATVQEAELMLCELSSVGMANTHPLASHRVDKGAG